jgi:positive regulator of sigma E activity
MPNQYSDFETGVVINVENDTALVELNIQAACDSCGARFVCMPDGSGKKRLTVANPLHAKIGNKVAIGETSQFLLKLSALQYGIPLVGFLMGIFLFHYGHIAVNGIPPEVSAFIGGLIGLFTGALISRWWANRIVATGRSFFSIYKILS